MYAFMSSDILQLPPNPNSPPSSNTSQIIYNQNIKTDPKWLDELTANLKELKTNFENLLKIITEYLAIIPVPLPDNVRKEGNDVVNILKNLRFDIRTIGEYIDDMLKT